MAKFQPGESGNPSGRPKGSPDSRTVLRELLKPHAVELVQKAVDMALEGNVQALKLCLDRCIPPLRSEILEDRERIEMPTIIQLVGPDWNED